MPQKETPRKGSLAFRPRKRAKRMHARIRRYQKSKDVMPLAFAGYKAGMTHIIAIDTKKGSHTQGREIQIPVTILECPPLKACGIKIYRKKLYGLESAGEVWSEKLDKEVGRRIRLPKNYNFQDMKNRRFSKLEKPEVFLKKLKQLDSLENISDVRLIVHTVPKNTGLGKKKPEIFEIAIGGSDIPGKINYAKEVLSKEINVSDVFKEGELVDVIGVSKGKGFTGPVKRMGVKILGRKEGKTHRGIGSLGQERPGKVRWQVAMPGQLGFHARTEFNKRLLKIGGDGKEITYSGGILHYGIIKNPYVLLQGSVVGTRKRLIKLRKAVRPPKIKMPLPEIKFISLESKQGV